MAEPSLSGLIRQMISRGNNIADDAPRLHWQYVQVSGSHKTVVLSLCFLYRELDRMLREQIL